MTLKQMAVKREIVTIPHPRPVEEFFVVIVIAGVVLGARAEAAAAAAVLLRLTAWRLLFRCRESVYWYRITLKYIQYSFMKLMRKTLQLPRNISLKRPVQTAGDGKLTIKTELLNGFWLPYKNKKPTVLSMGQGIGLQGWGRSFWMRSAAFST